MPLHSRYPLPAPAAARTGPGRGADRRVWTPCQVTAWAAKRDGWHAWAKFEDGKVRLVHADEVRRAVPDIGSS